MGQTLALFEADHSASPLWKITAIFLDSANRAAVAVGAWSFAQQLALKFLDALLVMACSLRLGFGSASPQSRSFAILTRGKFNGSEKYFSCSISISSPK
jgi:hypothetical protein